MIHWYIFDVWKRIWHYKVKYRLILAVQAQYECIF